MGLLNLLSVLYQSTQTLSAHTQITRGCTYMGARIEKRGWCHNPAKNGDAPFSFLF